MPYEEWFKNLETFSQRRKDLGGRQRAVLIISSFLKKEKGCQEEEELDLFCVTSAGGDRTKIFGYLPREAIWPTFSLL